MFGRVVYDKVEKRVTKNLLFNLVFDPRVGLKRFITSLKNLFNPTQLYLDAMQKKIFILYRLVNANYGNLVNDKVDSDTKIYYFVKKSF